MIPQACSGDLDSRAPSVEEKVIVGSLSVQVSSRHCLGSLGHLARHMVHPIPSVYFLIGPAGFTECLLLAERCALL